ncbi:TonB-dependent receptor [Candidatus Nitrospira allomarina]|uniref:TonB-dependent receptor n=1 Tax=Candidatus Nitrospira allomarina TaxID=3020900 RepID=A0AA96GA62_9BACT|nr:TonB-dependent receptor [Candidatus Nitrospira allomarina]WNM57771.1 TonB-dependent receptor [Candidatus Nitrospira allomarina]
MIVTGSAQPTQPHQSTQSITTLNAEQIAPLQPNRVTTILQQIPGLHTDEMSGRSGISSVYLRGADPNFTLIMLDGVPMNDSTNQRGGSVDLSTIPIDRIERVEIVRGPLSAFYGSEAMAGAINFITKSATTAPSFRLLGEGGRYDYLKGLAQTGGSLGPLSANLTLSHTQNGEQIEKDSFLMDSAGWNFSIQTDPNFDIQLNGQYTDSTVRSFPEGSGGSKLALLRETERRKTQEFLTGLSASFHIPSGWQHQVFLSVTRRLQDVSNPGILATPTTYTLPPADFETLYTRFQTRMTTTWTISPQWKFSLGEQLTHERGRRNGTQDLSSFGGSSDQPDDFAIRRTLGGAFAELTSVWWQKLTLNSGVRADISQGFQPKISPRIGAKYQLLNSIQIRGGYGRGFKLPSLSSLGDPLIGNPSLQPETSVGWDLGLDYHTFDERFTATIEYFHNRFRNLIDLDPDLLNQGIIRLANIDEAKTHGWNISLSLTPIPAVSFQSSLTHLTTRVTETGAQLRNRPKWRGWVGVTMKLSSTLNVKSQVTWVSSSFDFQVPTQTTRVGGFAKADITVNYHPFTEWSCYAALENVTNSSYEQFAGFPAPPLTFRLGLEYRPEL